MPANAPARSTDARRWPLFAAFTLATLLLIGCGSDDGSGPASNQSDAGFDDASIDPCATTNCGDATCVDRDGEPTCRCPVGTTFVPDSAACQLDQLLQDSSFDDLSAWNLQRGAFIDESTGELLLSKGAIADGAYAQQTFRLGSYDEIGPLVLELTMQYDDCGKQFCNRAYSRPAVLIDNRRQQVELSPFPSMGESATSSMCLGQAAYGGERSLTLMSGASGISRTSSRFNELSPWRISHLQFRRAQPDECPSPGVIDNGNFEQPSDAPWTFRTENSWTTNRIVNRPEGRALQLGGTGCSSARATNVVSIPSEPGTAITLETDITDSTSLVIYTKTAGLRHFVDQQPDAPVTVCVPRAILGTVQPLSFRPEPDRSTCTTAIDDIFVDNIRFTTDQRCDSDQLITGGDFDPSPFRGDWQLQATEPNTATFATETTPLGTNAYIRLQQTTSCDDPLARHWAHVPMPDEAPLNAITFFYRTTDVDDARASFYSSSTGFVSLEPAPLWTQKTVCFPAAPYGNVIDFFAQLDGTAPGGCREPLPDELQLHIDDITFANLATCVP